ncbi:hypothetical protein Tco_0437638, partial [Tanacetum coccineum]
MGLGLSVLLGEGVIGVLGRWEWVGVSCGVLGRWFGLETVGKKGGMVFGAKWLRYTVMVTVLK